MSLDIAGWYCIVIMTWCQEHSRLVLRSFWLDSTRQDRDLRSGNFSNITAWAAWLFEVMKNVRYTGNTHVSWEL